MLSHRTTSRHLTLVITSFSLPLYSVSRIVLVELSMFLSEKEERSLLDWLYKAKEHAGSMKPTRYNADLRRQEPMKIEEYRSLIDDQIAQLHANKKVIDKIKAHRDKAIVHLDKKYFDSAESIDRIYPLGDKDIDVLMDTVSGVLRKHYQMSSGSKCKPGGQGCLERRNSTDICAGMDASAKRFRSH